MSEHSQILVYNQRDLFSSVSSLLSTHFNHSLPFTNLVRYVCVYIFFIQMLYVNQLESLLLCSTRERERKKANKHGRVQKVFRTNYVSYDICVHKRVVCVWCLLCRIVVHVEHCFVVKDILHISVCHFEICGFAHFFLFHSMYCFFRGHHIFSIFSYNICRFHLF